MPSATLILENGTKITIEGSTAEVAALLRELEPGAAGRPPMQDRSTTRKLRRRRVDRQTPSNSARRTSTGPADYIRELIATDFFKAKQGLRDVQRKLEEAAHIYPITTLSPALFRLVRSKELRRIKDGGAWKYVNP